MIKQESFYCDYCLCWIFYCLINIAEGKTYLTIGIGCTGGVHRSPAIADEIAAHIRQGYGLETNVIHRDME